LFDLIYNFQERIKEKIEYMGGIFSHHLRDSTTHLMVGKVGSQKYIVSEIKYILRYLF